MSNKEVNRAIEAILMVVDEPINEVVLAQIIERPTEEIKNALGDLVEQYEREERGFELRQVAGGWRFYSHPDMSPMVEKIGRAHV